jgi:outer membrane lipoprotein SlyB
MKKTIVIGLLAAFATSANAQIGSRESLGGAVLGGIIGGVIGHNNGRQTAEGAAIGAGAGLILGALAQEGRSAPGPVRRYDSRPYPSRPNYALTGAALGGIAGGVIGHNSGRKTAEGIAIGTGSGLLLGALAEEDARRRDAFRVWRPGGQPRMPPVPEYAVEPLPPRPAALNSTASNRVMETRPSTANSMSSANRLFGR